MSESPDNQKQEAVAETTTKMPTNAKRIAALKSLMLGAGLIGALFLGGMGIAWLIQGPIFYEHKVVTLNARIVGNGPGALGIDASMVKNEKDKEGFKDTRHWFVLAYPGCEGAKQGFWIPDEPRKSAKQATLLNEIRTCFSGMTTGSVVPVVLRTRKRRSSGEQTWRVEKVGSCEAEVLTTLMNPDPGSKKCEWM